MDLGCGPGLGVRARQRRTGMTAVVTPARRESSQLVLGCNPKGLGDLCRRLQRQRVNPAVHGVVQRLKGMKKGTEAPF